MGAVYEATHRRLPGKRVAVKVLLGEIDQEAYARFRREAEIASRIGHPSIVEVIDFHATASGQPYLIMEFLEGESLRGRLKRGPLNLDKALDLTRQIGSALHAAHKHDVVHRDLKPDNIFLCPSDAQNQLPVGQAGINYREEDFVARVREATDGHGADLILDNMGAVYLRRNLAVLAVDGRLVSLGLQGGTTGELDLGRLMSVRGSVTAASLRAQPPERKAAIVAATHAFVWPALDTGEVRPIVDSVFDLADVAAAHRRVESSEHIGKVLLRVAATIDE
jgi:serine/threonine protein kinase